MLAVEQNKVLVPPSYTKYIAWGFADHSLRLASYESDKAIFVSEAIMQGSGEIVACVCPSAKIIVTAGTSCVSICFLVLYFYIRPIIPINECFDFIFCIYFSQS